MKFLTFVFSFHSIFALSQDIQFAKQQIDTLCSPYFAGRGFADSGMLKTGTYLAEMFNKFEIKPFKDQYTQQFSVSCNKILSTTLQNGNWKAGKDYLIDILSSSKNGTFEILHMSSEHFESIEHLQNFLNKDVSANIIHIPIEKLNSEQKELAYAMIYSDIINTAGFLLPVSGMMSWNIYMFRTPLSYPIIHYNVDHINIDTVQVIDIKIETKFVSDYTIYNIAGFIQGKLYPDSFIVLCAHYDHLGKMGENVYYPGANDNASGVAMMLDMMRYYSASENTPDYSIAFISFAAEESGLLGAKHYVSDPLFPIENIRFLINLDLVGTGKEGIQVVNSTIHSKEFELLININKRYNYLPQIKSRGAACNSDHCPFHEAGLKTFFVYTLDSEYLYYHVPEDIPIILPLTSYEWLFKLLQKFISAL